MFCKFNNAMWPLSQIFANPKHILRKRRHSQYHNYIIYIITIIENQQYNNKMQQICKQSAQESQPQVIFQKEQEVLIQQYTQVPKNLQVFELQVSGKTPKYVNNANDIIYKEYSQREYTFYQSLKQIKAEDPRHQLMKYFPHYYGIQTQEAIGAIPQFNINKEKSLDISSQRNIWIEHITSRNKAEHEKEKNVNEKKKKFLMMQNLTVQYLIPNIIDLKLGRKKPKKSNVKFQISTTNSHNFRINGMMVGVKLEEKYEQCFISKYFGQKITLDEVQRYLALFFYSGANIHIDLLRKVIIDLQDLIKTVVQFSGVRFLSSSLFICYDVTNPQRYSVKIIDFDKYEIQKQLAFDENIEKGLVNILTFFHNILQNVQIFQQILRQKDLSIFHSKCSVVPENVIKKYETKEKEDIV